MARQRSLTGHHTCRRNTKNESPRPKMCPYISNSRGRIRINERHAMAMWPQASAQISETQDKKKLRYSYLPALIRWHRVLCPPCFQSLSTVKTCQLGQSSTKTYERWHSASQYCTSPQPPHFRSFRSAVIRSRSGHMIHEHVVLITAMAKSSISRSISPMLESNLLSSA